MSIIKIDSVLESGYLQPFLENNVYSIFTEVGNSERPDTVCGKILEGRIAILVDGTPFCLIVPHLFVENFQNLDDYTLNPVFVSFIILTLVSPVVSDSLENTFDTEIILHSSPLKST